MDNDNIEKFTNCTEAGIQKAVEACIKLAQMVEENGGDKDKTFLGLQTRRPWMTSDHLETMLEIGQAQDPKSSARGQLAKLVEIMVPPKS